jgi:hypothetical protein
MYSLHDQSMIICLKIKKDHPKRTRFAEQHPYWFVAILEIVVMVVYFVAGTTAYFLKLSTMGLYGLANFGLTMIVALLLYKGILWPLILSHWLINFFSPSFRNLASPPSRCMCRSL